MHGYYGWHKPEDEELARSMTDLMIKLLGRIEEYGKPRLFAEFGIERGRPEGRALCEKDREGVHLHAGLWTPVMVGAAGTGAIWWWGSYVDPKNLYYHFNGVAAFTKDIPWTTASFEKAVVESKDENLRVLGLRGKPLSILWLENKAHSWWNVVHGKAIAPVPATEITLSIVAAGIYRVEYWDTCAGRIMREVEARAAGGKLPIAVPEIERDIAIKIFPIPQSNR